MADRQANITYALHRNCSQPQNITQDERMVVMFQYHAWGIAGNIISILGIIGNVLSIVVLSNSRMRSSTSYYLISLAVFDCIVLISQMLFLALPTIYNGTGMMESYHQFYPYMHPFGYPVALTAQTCSIYTTVAFTVERYIAVCKPLQAAKMCTISRARKGIGLLVLLAIIYNIPRMLEHVTVTVRDPCQQEFYGKIEPTRLGRDKLFRSIYFIYMHMCVMLILPFATLCVLNTLLVRAVRQSQNVQGKMNTRTKRENNLTVMLISVVAVFLVCQVPSIVDNILYATKEPADLGRSPFIELTSISSLMVIANSASNFYLYCCFGQKFRKVFCSIFCRCSPYLRKKLLENDTTIMLSTHPHNTGHVRRLSSDSQSDRSGFGEDRKRQHGKADFPRSPNNIARHHHKINNVTSHV